MSKLIGMFEKLKNSIINLKHTGVAISYCDKHLDTNVHWIYEPNELLDHHRILGRDS